MTDPRIPSFRGENGAVIRDFVVYAAQLPAAELRRIAAHAEGTTAYTEVRSAGIHSRRVHDEVGRILAYLVTHAPIVRRTLASTAEPMAADELARALLPGAETLIIVTEDDGSESPAARYFRELVVPYGPFPRSLTP